MKEKRNQYYIMLHFFLLSLYIYPQASIKEPMSPKPNGPVHPELPIDGGIYILLVIGLIYGLYKSKQ